MAWSVTINGTGYSNTQFEGPTRGYVSAFPAMMADWAAVVNRFDGVLALTSGTTVNTDASSKNAFTLTLAHNATLANPTGLTTGRAYIWRIIQDGTGSRTLAYGNLFKWVGGTVPILSTTAGAIDLISSFYDGTSLLGVCQKGFA